MSTMELLIGVGGLVAGYWIVSKLMVGAPPPSDAEHVRRDEPTPGPDPEPQRNRAVAWHDTLNVPPDASPAQIKHAYRMLMNQYHPDKVATLGDELKRVAERKSREINLAYEEAMRLRGENG